MDQIKQILINRLEKNGLELCLIPGFMRTLATSFINNPDSSLLQINEKLHYLGWDEFDIDYHTLQLAIVCIEAEGLESFNDIQTLCLNDNATSFSTPSSKILSSSYS
jgi:hypothetical protein